MRQGVVCVMVDGGRGSQKGFSVFPLFDFDKQPEEKREGGLW